MVYLEHPIVSFLVFVAVASHLSQLVLSLQIPAALTKAGVAVYAKPDLTATFLTPVVLTRSSFHHQIAAHRFHVCDGLTKNPVVAIFAPQEQRLERVAYATLNIRG